MVGDPTPYPGTKTSMSNFNSRANSSFASAKRLSDIGSHDPRGTENSNAEVEAWKANLELSKAENRAKTLCWLFEGDNEPPLDQIQKEAIDAHAQARQAVQYLERVLAFLSEEIPACAVCDAPATRHHPRGPVCEAHSERGNPEIELTENLPIPQGSDDV